jgi:hypothetical protein
MRISPIEQILSRNARAKCRSFFIARPHKSLTSVKDLDGGRRQFRGLSNGATAMSFNEQIFLGLVIVSLALFAITLGYQSFAEWRDQNKKRD